MPSNFCYQRDGPLTSQPFISGKCSDIHPESFSSAQSPIPAAAAMASPRVTVSVWDRNGGQPVSTLPRSFASGNGSLRNPRLGNDDALSVETLHGSVPSVTRDTKGGWMPNMATGQGGLPPDNRPSDETMSANELATARKVDKSNEQVASWLSDTADQTKEHHPDGSMNKNDSRSAAEDDNIPSTEIPLGHTTVNRHIPNQVYYTTNFQDDDKGGPSSGGFNQTDFDLLPKRNWADAPMIHSIDLKKTQPESSQDAIAKFERSCQDNASFVSRAATWGTRRRSLPSVYDTEGVISGGFFKMLSLKGESSLRRPSLLKKIPSLVRRPSSSQILKRKGSNGEEVTEESTSSNRRESRDSLAPPPRSPSWGMKQKLTPSLNTAILGMSTGAASIGASHARTGSISASSMASPKSPFGLAPVKNHLRRARSKTEIPKTELSHPNIVGMMKKAGGPPAVQLPKSHTMLDQDEDEDDEEEPFDDLDMKMEAGQTVDIAPTTDGFHQHILRLNPDLAHTNQYLVDRIAHQMVVRFKNLQNQKIKHLKAARLGYCKSGSFCLETGGQAVPLDPKGDARGFEPLSSRSQSPDGDVTPFEGGLNADTFPAGIPMPPTTVLPAVSISAVS